MLINSNRTDYIYRLFIIVVIIMENQFENYLLHYFYYRNVLLTNKYSDFNGSLFD